MNVVLAPYAVALTHELLPQIGTFVIFAVLLLSFWHFIWHEEKTLITRTKRVWLTLGISIWIIVFWYQAALGRDSNALARWLNVSVSSSAAKLARETTEQIEAVFHIVLWLVIAVVLTHRGDKAFAIFAWIILMFAIYISINSLFG